MNLNEYFKYHRKGIESTLDLLLPSGQIPPSTIHKAMRYAVFNGGKRLRPLIAIASADYLNIRIDRTIYAIAGIIEIIHTYSLIHDDLPAMDDSSLRRGKPTVHKMFNEPIAILAGDALLTYAFEALGNISMLKKSGDIKNLLVELAHHIGTAGLVGGQVVDIEAKNKKIGMDDIDFIHRNKTAALIRFSAIAPAVFFKRKTKIHELRDYGESLGMAFQIGDDIDDHDKSENKGEPSIVNVVGLDTAKDLFYEYIDKAKSLVKQKENNKYLIGICDWVKESFNL